MLVEQIKLEESENIVQVVRKHWFILFSFIVGDVLLALLPLFGYLAIIIIFNGLPAGTLAALLSAEGLSGTLWFFYLAWLLLIWMHFTNHLTDYYLDLWVITDRRIVAIDQRGFFRRFLSSFRLERLQDLNVEVNGFIATLLNFGTIDAQTAGSSNEEFKTANMPDPRGLKALIIRLADERQRVTSIRTDAL
jgi:hypothetical protein